MQLLNELRRRLRNSTNEWAIHMTNKLFYQLNN